MKRAPTKEEIKDYMERHNADEVGIGDQWDLEEAEYFLLFEDEFHNPPPTYAEKMEEENIKNGMRDILTRKEFEAWAGSDQMETEQMIELILDIANNIYSIEDLVNNVKGYEDNNN